MAGGNPKDSSSHRQSRWESNKNPPSDTKSGNTKPPPSGNTKNPSSDTKATNKPPPNPKPDPSPGPSKPSPNQNQNQIPPNQPGGPGLLPGPPGGPFQDQSGFGGPSPPPPAYGFPMLERRTIALADGSVRSYLALPPDYQDFPPQSRPPFDREFFPFGGRDGVHFPPPAGRLSPEGFRRGGGGGEGNEMFGRGPMPLEGSLKRKYVEGDERDGRDEFARQRQQLLQYGNPNANGFPGVGSSNHMGGTSSSPFRRDPLDPGSGRGGGLDDMRGLKHMRIGGDHDLSSGQRGMPSGDANLMMHHQGVDPQALKKAFLRFVKLINENTQQKVKYLENGKQGTLQCLACSRGSKEFPDLHGLIMHAYNSHSADLHVDHLGLHKALCVLMGWNYAKIPDNSKVYQSFSANEAEANKEDLILWPPLVIIHNTNTGRGKDGRTEGMGNKVMDNKLKDLGFGGGKAKSLYAKEGHLGVTLVKFAADHSGLKDAMRLAEFFEKDYHGRNGWARAQASQSGRDDENNPNLVKVDEKTREKQRILYGYLATALDLEKVDVETRKKTSIDSKRELKP